MRKMRKRMRSSIDDEGKGATTPKKKENEDSKNRIDEHPHGRKKYLHSLCKTHLRATHIQHGVTAIRYPRYIPLRFCPEENKRD